MPREANEATVTAITDERGNEEVQIKPNERKKERERARAQRTIKMDQKDGIKKKKRAQRRWIEDR